MVRKGKLDLMNCRLAGPPQAAAVFDSSLDNALPNTMSTLSTSNYDFDKTLRRDQQRNPEIYHSNEIVDPSTHTYDGTYLIHSHTFFNFYVSNINTASCCTIGDEVTFKQRVLNSPVKSYVKERRSNHFEHLYNETAEIYRVARKIDTTICKWPMWLIDIAYSCWTSIGAQIFVICAVPCEFTLATSHHISPHHMHTSHSPTHCLIHCHSMR